MTVPERIGRYRVVEQAGTGGFAAVWKAEDEVLNAPVAIKILNDNRLDSADVRERFLQEARLLRKVDSDRVVRVYDIGDLPDGRPYFVMTYADRGTLAARLSGGPMPWREAVAVAIDIGEALLELHAAGVLHRDLKPSNILFRTVHDGEQILLGDLGLAKPLSEASLLTLACGSPGYMAPEQGMGGQMGTHTDVYGLGAVLYRLITGRRIDTGSAPSFPGGTPAGVAGIVRRALHADLKQRYADIEGLLAELRGVRGGRLVGLRSWSRRMLRSRRFWPAASVVLLAAIAVPIGANALPSSLEVTDDSGTIVLSVPSDWAVQVAGTAWDTTPLAARGGKQPAILVSASADHYAEVADTRPGVFVGLLSRETALSAGEFRARVARGGCHEDRPLDAADAVVSMRRLCGRVVIDDLLLARSGRQAWVQVKQPSDQTTRADGVLSSLRFGGDRR
ncbi:MAG TPA: serine/threonine-protein kinase [Amycolatopsis sp.]|nr:serine/threonine-protein kinase [Amycolatopsis sp.]